jgi:hypothetical protein
LFVVVVVVVVVSVILVAGDRKQEREKKSLFNCVRSEQLLPRLGELLFISFGFSPSRMRRLMLRVLRSFSSNFVVFSQIGRLIRMPLYMILSLKNVKHILVNKIKNFFFSIVGRL